MPETPPAVLSPAEHKAQMLAYAQAAQRQSAIYASELRHDVYQDAKASEDPDVRRKALDSFTRQAGTDPRPPAEDKGTRQVINVVFTRGGGVQGQVIGPVEEPDEVVDVEARTVPVEQDEVYEPLPPLKAGDVPDFNSLLGSRKEC